jgi:hypothetical protein
MPEVVPSGYFSIREALNLIGRRLFPSDWTGEEHRARSGLISEEEWLKIKDLPPARGSDAPGSGRVRPATPSPPRTPRSTGDPASAAYQQEHRARLRYAEARDRLRFLLAGGELEAAVLDPWTGALHRASAALWRRWDATQILEKGQAPLPQGRNTGSVLIRQFTESPVPPKPLPRAKIQEAIAILQAKMKTESLTRDQQGDFLRKAFPTYRVTERELRKIFEEVPMPTGRPKKSDKKI